MDSLAGRTMNPFFRFSAFGRLARVALAGFALAVTALVLSAAPASAHATLDSTTPEQGSELTSPPSSVSLHFSEAVGIGVRAIEVLDGAGRRVDDGAPRHPDGNGDVVEVDIPRSLPQGSYTVDWRVVSADSHPIAGTFSFGVHVPAGAASISATEDPAVSAVDAVLRGTAYVGAVLLVGGAFFLVVLWPAGFAIRRCRRLLIVGWVASTAAAAGLFLLQGPYGAGVGLAAALDPQLLGDTLASRYGKLMLLRLVVLAFAVPALRRAAPSASVAKARFGRRAGLPRDGVPVVVQPGRTFGSGEPRRARRTCRRRPPRGRLRVGGRPRRPGDLPPRAGSRPGRSLDLVPAA